MRKILESLLPTGPGHPLIIDCVCGQTHNLCLVLSPGIWQSLRVTWAGDGGWVRIWRPGGPGPSLRETAEVLGGEAQKGMGDKAVRTFHAHLGDCGHGQPIPMDSSPNIV